MHTKFLRILTLGFDFMLLVATLPGQVTKAQTAESGIPTRKQSIDTKSSFDMIELSAYQTAPLFPDQTKKLVLAQAAIASAEQSLANTLEAPTDWTQRFPPVSPYPRYLHAMAYDSARGVTVLFGGGGGGLDSLTWEWDGTHWLERNPAHNPSLRCRHTMAYDSVRGVVSIGCIHDAPLVGWLNAPAPLSPRRAGEPAGRGHPRCTIGGFAEHTVPTAEQVLPRG